MLSDLIAPHPLYQSPNCKYYNKFLGADNSFNFHQTNLLLILSAPVLSLEMFILKFITVT